VRITADCLQVEPTRLLLFISRSIRLFTELDHVESPQPICNPNQLQNKKSDILQKVLEDEVVGPVSLLLLI
jgi:hypothetical protein